ncbi:UNVERIFIED_CONTAM: hypothetical protein FKN15_063698 [Acipenser sinensis]
MDFKDGPDSIGNEVTALRLCCLDIPGIRTRRETLGIPGCSEIPPAQLRSRVRSADAVEGEEPAESCGRHGDREGEESVAEEAGLSKADLSKRSKFMKLPTFNNALLKRVLPGRGEKTERGERGSESSGTNWLQALKFKKKNPK